MSSDVLAYALRYLELGYHPIPVQAGGKKAVVKWKEFQDAAPTEEQVREWFSRPCNVALVLGRGTMAVDLDGPGAEDLLRARGVQLPDLAPRSKTSDGYHVLLEGSTADAVGLLKTPELRPGTKKPASSVDVRGVGYIVAPPSVHPSGHIYDWVVRPAGVEELPVAPPELMALLANGKGPGSAPATSLGSVPSDAPKWVSAALRGVGEGERDATCARLAGYFLSKQIPQDVVSATLYAFADRCRPPFPRAEVDKTVVSVARRESQKPAVDADPSRPFQVLGHNRGAYFYLPAGSRQVVELTPRAHVKLALLELAPIGYWEKTYQGTEGANWTAAANHLIRLAHAAGVFDPAHARGRGAWWDDPHAVLHLGDRLVINGAEAPLDAGRGRYVYEAAPPMSVPLADPLDPQEAHRLVSLLELLNWENPLSARLLAGWCVVAPICGALSWRPHIWVTGPAGSGKTWVVDNIVRRLVGDVGLAVQSETTEAGLRQTLGHDARPIIFDEAEGENERAQLRIQNILALMRQASSETGAAIIKGSATGAARSYRIRSCFAFSSIGVGVQQHADATRVSVLSLAKAEGAGRFGEIQAARYQLLTDTWMARLLARSIRLIPVIRANARTFAAAGAGTIGSQRLGDQVGALLAGAYSLYSDEAVSTDEAEEWMGKQDWTEQRSSGDTADETACLQRILEAVVFVQAQRFSGKRSVAELLNIAAGKADALETPLLPTDAIGALARIGVRYDCDEFIVANNHSGIADILEKTPWARGWSRILRRVPGARALDAGARFAGVKARGIAFPMEVLK